MFGGSEKHTCKQQHEEESVDFQGGILKSSTMTTMFWRLGFDEAIPFSSNMNILFWGLCFMVQE
jgi:hypothetical protein